MKSTGIIRRIDDLGRIVIPKEIRKSMRIKDGESLEIYLDCDNIILKKYSEFNNLIDFYNSYVSSINSVLNENVLIIDRNKVISISGNFKKRYINMIISDDLEDILEKRVVVFSKKFKDIFIINDCCDRLSYTIAPIISSGDIVGGIIIFSDNREITDLEIKIVTMASKFLGIYVE